MRRSLAAAAACLCLVGCVQPGTPQGSALESPPAHGWSITQEVGSQFTDGFETLDVVSNPVEVTSVDMVGGEPGIKLLGYEIVPPGRSYATIQSMPGFPPQDPDLSPARVPPGGQLTVDPDGQGYQLLLGIEVSAKGRWTRTEIVVQYRSAGTTYQQSFPAQLAVCTPDATDKNGSCPVP